jgi:hypothetical protein
VITTDGVASQIFDHGLTPVTTPAEPKESHMFTHPDLLGSLVSQRHNELMAEADRGRILTIALNRRRAARAAARAARRALEVSATPVRSRTVSACEPHPAR